MKLFVTLVSDNSAKSNKRPPLEKTVYLKVSGLVWRKDADKIMERIINNPNIREIVGKGYHLVEYGLADKSHSRTIGNIVLHSSESCIFERSLKSHIVALQKILDSVPKAVQKDVIVSITAEYGYGEEHHARIDVYLRKKGT